MTPTPTTEPTSSTPGPPRAALTPLVVAGGEGSWFWTEDGTRYLDFSSQLVNVNIGHQHPKLVAAIQEQADTAVHHRPVPRQRGAQRGGPAHQRGGQPRRSRRPLRHVFFTNGGAEATENAMRMARLHTGRHKVLTTYRSYHGGTGGAITLTGDPRRWPSEPGIPGVVKFWGPYPYRSPFHAADEAEESAAGPRRTWPTCSWSRGRTTSPRSSSRPVVGTNGILVPPPGYLAGVRELCDRHGIVLIGDEVMAGFGRCGEWFAFHHWGVQPDLVCFAKGVNSGYLPLGGVVISRAIADTFKDRAYPGGLTYSGHPLACASAVASINIFKEEGIVEHARMLGTDVIGPALEKLQANHPSIGEVRGLGVFWAIELVRNRETREPLVPFNAAGADAKPMNDIAAACKAKGVWPFTHFNRMHVVPPCTTSEADVERGIAVLDEALELADALVTG